MAIAGINATHFQVPVERPLTWEHGAAAPRDGTDEVVLGVDVPGQRIARGKAGGRARGPAAREGVLGAVVRGQLLFGREACAAVRTQTEEEVCHCCLLGWE